MNTFLKILVLVVLAVVAVKLLPAALVLIFLLAAGVVLAGCVGLTLAVAVFGAALVVAAALAPLWIPVLAIAGIIALVRRSRARSA